jgi:hypothetical protein
MSRPDTYILKLLGVKNNLKMQIQHCSRSLAMLQEIIKDSNYEEQSYDFEKANITNLITLITDGLEKLEEIKW